MKVIGVTLLCGVLMTAAAAPAQGDEVDDLLAGKPPQAKSDRQRAERSAKAATDAANAAEKSDDDADA